MMERKTYAVEATVQMAITTSSPQMARALAHAWLKGCPNNAVVAVTVPTMPVEVK
jgi:hypothetical protein